MNTSANEKMREAFEAMHKGRNLIRHHLRGTYIKPQIAALWNQHVKTWQAALSTVHTQEVSGEAERQIIATYEQLHKGKIGMHWLWAAILRLNAGESELSVMEDFGYVSDSALQSQAGTPPAEREGWKLVPVEPTIAMVEAAELDACGRLLADDIADAYSAMLSAAQKAKP